MADSSSDRMDILEVKEPGLIEQLKNMSMESIIAEQLTPDQIELQNLKTQENIVMEAYAVENFKPLIVTRGYFEAEEARDAREILENKVARENFIQENRPQILLEALRVEIRKNLSRMPEGLETLNKEEKAQSMLTPLYKARITQRFAEASKIGQDRANDRYYAKAPIVPPKNITNDAPQLARLVGAHYRTQLLQKELAKPRVTESVADNEKAIRHQAVRTNQARSDRASKINKNVTDGRVLDGRAKKFSRLI